MSLTHKTKIRILHITFDMRIGGTEQVIKNLVSHTDFMQFTPEILCIEGPLGPFSKPLVDIGVRFYELNRRPGFDVSLIRAIRSIIKQGNFDVIHCHQYTPYVYGCLASILTGAKIIFTEHGRFYPDIPSWKRKLVNPLLALFTDHISAISQATVKALAHVEGFQENKMKVIYNGIAKPSINPAALDLLKQALHITEETLVFGHIARLEPIKNQAMMINAFAQLKQRVAQPCKLIIVGDGSQRKSLEALSKQLNCETDILFTGYIDAPDDYLGLFNIYLLSSFSEGTSMTLLEAMAIGIPCVVTDVGGNPEVVKHNETGLVSPNDDVTAFSNNMLTSITWLEQTDVDNTQGHTLRSQHIKQRFNDMFSIDAMVEAYQSLYLGKK